MASFPYFTVAEHAATAVAYTLRVMLAGEAQEAAWAARHVYEAIDEFVLSTTKIDLNAPGAEDKILSDQLVQKELGRQRRDLEDIIGKTEIDARNAILHLRERSEREPALPI